MHRTIVLVKALPADLCIIATICLCIGDVVQGKVCLPFAIFFS